MRHRRQEYDGRENRKYTEGRAEPYKQARESE